MAPAVKQAAVHALQDFMDLHDKRDMNVIVVIETHSDTKSGKLCYLTSGGNSMVSTIPKVSVYNIVGKMVIEPQDSSLIRTSLRASKCTFRALVARKDFSC